MQIRIKHKPMFPYKFTKDNETSITWIETDLSTILTTPTSNVHQLKNNTHHRKPKYANASRQSTLQPTLKTTNPINETNGTMHDMKKAPPNDAKTKINQTIRENKQ